MKSCITVQILFSFKGETYSPRATIEFDRYLEKNESIPSYDLLVAHHNDIDTYSYLFEVMQHGDVVFSNPEGLAVEFCRADEFDLVGFVAEWKQQSVLHRMAEIAHEHLAVDSLDENESIKKALLQAYQLGKNSR